MNPGLALIMMALATFILTKLVVDLSFPPVLWLRDRVVGGWRPLTMAEGELLRSKDKPMGALGFPVKPFATSEENGESFRWVDRSPRVPLFFAELMSCPWCVSAWLSAGTVAGTWLTVGLPVPVLYWPATWALGALLAQHDYA